MPGIDAFQDVLKDEAFARVKQAVIGRTGHSYYEDKDAALAERLKRRLSATGRASLSAYDRLLQDPAEGPSEWSALISEVTIGETYFFRFREHFDALRSVILPGIIERNRISRRIRIWSAGASSGAEAYSVAIVLSDLLGDQLPDWSVSIIGSDIDEVALEAARTGVFSSWALRAVEPIERERLFDPLPGGRFQLKRVYRAMVRFTPQNLLSLLDGPPPLQFTDFDVVLCRNVLIYFDHETVRRLVEAIGGTLSLEGWLLLGHAETNPAFIGSLMPVELRGATVYRRMANGPALLELPADVAPAPLPAAPAVPPRVARTPRAPVRPKPPVPVATDGSIADVDVVGLIRSAADSGNTERALCLCREAQQSAQTDPVLRFYEGLLHRTGSDPVAAAAAFRRAIYLDREFALAHYHLGLALLASGDRDGGRRALANAGRIAAAGPADRTLAEGDGLTAGDLVDLARLVLAEGARS